MRFVVAVSVVAGCYSPSYKDCEITCATSNACPDGFSCDTANGVCRQHGVEASCGSTRDSGADAKQCLGFTLATNFDPCVVGDSNGDTTVVQKITYNTDLGMLEGSPLPGFEAGTLIDQGQGQRVRVLKFGDLYITPAGQLQLVGVTPILFVVHTMRIEGAVDLDAAHSAAFTACTATEGIGAGMGGGGGGGGGFAATGGGGGEGGDAATITGRALGGAMLTGGFSPLRSSCPGRTGGAASNAVGGVGGAAGGSIQVTARDSITVSGSIRANGAGGGPASSIPVGAMTYGAGGGGGGAGGVIFLEAPVVTVGSTARLCANGGGGGGGAGGMAGQAGTAVGGDMLCANSPPSGGPSYANAGPGGSGGSVVAPSGRPGNDTTAGSPSGGGGGGGGSVGQIGVRSTTPMIMTPQVASPAIQMLP